MPNDIPDWTAQAKVNLVGGLSGVNLADVAAPQLATDAASETITSGGGPLLQANAVMASFKAAAAAVIAQVGALGALAVGSNTSVSPAFGQATTSGNFLLAWVTAGTGEPTTAAAGWAKVLDTQAGGSQWSALWARPNCGAAEAAPTFTSAGGTSPMHAQLAEFSGVATASSTDKTGSTSGTSGTLSPVNSGVDVAFGDLVAFCARWALTNPSTATFSDTINNGATVVHAGDTGATSQTRQSSFNFAIIPAATVAQPLGTAPWAYDSTGQAAPAVSTQASVVLAATPGKAYTAAMLSATMADQTAPSAREEDCQLKDGSTVLLTWGFSVTVNAGDKESLAVSGLGYKGTTGNSMTWAFSSAGTNIFYRVGIGAYLR